MVGAVMTAFVVLIIVDLLRARSLLRYASVFRRSELALLLALILIRMITGIILIATLSDEKPQTVPTVIVAETRAEIGELTP